MTTPTLAPTRRTAVDSPRRITVVLQGLGLVATLVVAVRIAEALSSPHLGRTTVLGVAALLALAAAGVALTSFSTFLLGFVLLRPLLDASKALSLPGGGVVGTGAAGLLVLMGVLWFAGQNRAGRRYPLSFLGQALALVVLSMAISTVASLDVSVSAAALARTLTAAVLLVLLEQRFRTPEQAKTLLLVALASAAAPLLVGLLQIASGSYARSEDGVGRVTGTLVHPNSLGFYLVLIITMATAMFRYVETRTRVFLAVLLAVASLELVLTYSRGSWLALALALVIVGVFQVRKLLVLLPVGAGLVVLLVPSVASRLTDLATTESVIGTPGNSLLWRFSQWQESLSLVHGRVVTGIGPSMVDVLTDRPPHNDAVRMYTEVGVLGLVTYLVFMVALVVLAVTTLRRAPAGLPRGVAVGFAASAAAFVLDSNGDNLITQVVMLTYVFVFACAARAMLRRAPDQPAAQPETDSPARPVPLP